MLQEAIRNNWATDIKGYAQIIPGLKDSDYPAWTIRFEDSYGVALPYNGVEEINEHFSNAHIYSTDIVFNNIGVKKAIVLSTTAEGMEGAFSALCSELIDPGENGEKRKRILSSPLEWWKSWKEMIGNRNIDARIYDVLGELCVLKLLVEKGEDAIWNGPNGASYDIETDKYFAEVKSTIARDKREVTISNLTQLDPPGKPLCVILCQFEPTALTGLSIDSIISEFREMGYNTAELNAKLFKMGLEEGMSARKKTFVLHAMLKYTVDADFPRITSASFAGGVIPAGIVKLSYPVDLGGMIPESMLEGDKTIK